MKTLGMLGGLGPESTVAYYETIIRLYRERAGDGSYPQFIMNSVNMKNVVDPITANDLAGVARFLTQEMQKLVRAGADFGLISANTPHVVFDEVQAAVAIPLISIVEATCAAVKKRGLQRLVLLGTRFTMQGAFYPKVFGREGIELVSPDPEDREYIHDKYMNELVSGTFLPETRAGLLAIVDRLAAKSDIQGVILGGTELPLLLRGERHNGIPLLDTMRIHVEAAVAEMFSG
ncbi:MAG TPA: amino acid racemase [Chthoniobacterales bacterium]|jgi:aspartate racemase